IVPKPRASKARSSSSSRPTAPAARYGFLTVGQTAKILGVSPSTLRLWESEGLIAPPRTTGRYRLYSPELLKVLKRIKYLREVQRRNMPGIRRELKDETPGQSSGEASDVANGMSSGSSGRASPDTYERRGYEHSGDRHGGRGTYAIGGNSGARGTTSTRPRTTV